MWLGWLIWVAMISRIAKNFQDYFVNVMTQHIGTSIYQHTINHTFSLPYKVFEDQQSGQLLQKLVKAKDSIQTYIASLINVVFFALVGMVFVLSYSFLVDRRIGVAYLILLPIMTITTMMMSRYIKKAQETISKESNIIAGSITESIRNVSLIKMLWLVWQEIKRLDVGNKKILWLELKKIQTVRLIEFIQGTLINAMRVCLIGLLWYLVYINAITIGELMSLYFYSFFLFGQLSLFGTVAKNYQEAKANHDILQDIMKQSKEPTTHHLHKLSDIKTITFNTVSFGYQEQNNILHNISRTVKAGQNIAFVWPSGSGKSTILKLLAWLYPPSQWDIMYNNMSVSTLDVTHLKQRIWLVSQDAQLFTGTIRDNLIFVQPRATDQDCRTVLAQASLDTFIRELPEWLMTMIGEWGIKLSGGQRQRLAIARALIRKPDILIFDEATSALDSIVEKEISDTIHLVAQSNPQLITILVAHRLSTVMRSDVIYVLEQWTIVESGKHDQLIDQKWLYYALWREQSGKN